MVLKEILLWLCLFAVAHASSSCGIHFDERCTCGMELYDDLEQYVVKCINVGYPDADVLQYLPDETQVLVFTGNNIPELPWNVFGVLRDLKDLRVVDMSNNKIREILGKSFHHVRNVQRLLLNHNELRISADDDINHPRVFSNFLNLTSLHLTNAFADNTDSALSNDLHRIFVGSNLTLLNKLHLEQNEIRSFQDKDVFCNLPSLLDLYLGDNNLTGIDFNILCLKHLRFLDLESNTINILSKRDLSLLDQLTNDNHELRVDLTGNPFRCDCLISDFHTWLQTTHVGVRKKELITCNTPQIHAGDAVLSLSIDKCVQLAAATPTVGHTVTMTFLLFFLIVILIALIAALIYLSRDRLKVFVAPILDTVSKKVQYTTIKNQENSEQDV